MNKQKHHSNQTWFSWSFVHIGAVVVLVGALVAVWMTAPKNKTDDVSLRRAPASKVITTPDGTRLTYDLSYPAGTHAVPAVILVHGLGQDRLTWAPYAGAFLDHGWAVLRYDLRGFGESPISPASRAAGSWLTAAPDDVATVVNFLRHQPRIQADAVSVVGVAVGANIAFVANGRGAQIYRTVLLSPVVMLGGFGTEDPNFRPHAIFGLAAVHEDYMTPLLGRASDPKKELVLETDRSGIQLLDDGRVRNAVFDWLEK